mmetsp:Transcript_20121/g.33901  ORF Transcript_20121/g.33901 Transcript_20121/m.33901 type:complete len:130 (+) Transcript_20121:65-454(+)
MPTGSGTNSNMNGIRIESRVLAPPGGFSSISFGGEASNTDKFKGHNFNPKTQKKIKEQQAKEVENVRPVHKNECGIPGLESHYPVKTTTQQPLAQQQPSAVSNTAPSTQQFPGRRGRGAGESSFSLGWE